MKLRSPVRRGVVTSQELEKRLKLALKKNAENEKKYRETNQRFWTLVFIDVPASARPLWGKKEEDAGRILASYQQLIRTALDEQGASFIEPAGGTLVLATFEEPAPALAAAYEVLQALDEWTAVRPEGVESLPAIGIHQGYVNFYGGTIHQSNTSNIAQRIQSEAKSGQILVSSAIYEELKTDPRFEFGFVGTYTLKNIPEPQDIYQATPAGEATPSPSPPREIQSLDTVLVTNVDFNTYHWAFVYIDVCESTRKFWKYGDQHASLLIQDYQKLCHETFTACGSCYVKSCEGDQIIAAFEIDDIDSAAVASIKILKDLFRRNVNFPPTKHVRAAIGIHLGEVVIQGESLVQTQDMRVGKAIQSQALADEILLSLEAARLLDPEIVQYTAEYGSCQFPGISESYELRTLKWFHASLRPSLLYPSRKRTSRIKVLYR